MESSEQRQMSETIIRMEERITGLEERIEELESQQERTTEDVRSIQDIIY